MLSPTPLPALLFGRMISFPTVDYLAVGLYIIDSLGEAPAAPEAPISAGLFCIGLIMLEFEMVEG